MLGRLFALLLGGGLSFPLAHRRGRVCGRHEREQSLDEMIEKGLLAWKGESRVGTPSR